MAKSKFSCQHPELNIVADHLSLSDFHNTPSYSKLTEYLTTAPNVTERLTQGREQSIERYIKRARTAIDGFGEVFDRSGGKQISQ